ncbi:MAG TPA: protein-disulfide reductase DsbD family protein, partial [Candidatus Marinimicrobia bacterium]|nr:protein-disulfide reductase DsbD family protein [Candidatus Neomarinimicrobiota bacterium]
MNKAFQSSVIFEKVVSLMRRLLFSLLLLLPGIMAGQDLFNEDFGAKTKVSLLVETAVAKAGTTVNVGLHLTMPEGWHTYWKNPGETGEATKVKWNNLPEGVTAGNIHWPVPEKVESFDQFTYAYHHEILLIIPLELAKDMKPGEYELNGTVTWLECEETCLPGEKKVTAKLVVDDEEKMGEGADLFAKWRENWPDTESMPKLTAKWVGSEDDKGMRLVHMEVPL